MPKKEGVSGKVWKREEAGCEKIRRVWHARRRYNQKDWQFILNTISLQQVPAWPYQYKGTSRKGSNKERTNEE